MLSDPQVWLSLLTLTALEVVLSIDNLVVIAVLVGKLPKTRQAQARYIGMTLALIPRLVLLFFIGWIIGLTEPLFELFGHGVSGKDLILAAGGLFLIYKATQEIHGAWRATRVRPVPRCWPTSPPWWRRSRSSIWCSRSTASSPRSAWPTRSGSWRWR